MIDRKDCWVLARGRRSSPVRRKGGPQNWLRSCGLNLLRRTLDEEVEKVHSTSPDWHFLLILAACAGDDDANGATETPTATTTSLASTYETLEFQYVRVNRTLLPCQVVQEFMDAVNESTNGRIEIQLSSYPELGISGLDTISLLKDGTIGFGEIYSGFVGGEFPVFDVANLWGTFGNLDQWFAASDGVADDILQIVKKETDGGEVVVFNYYSSQYFSPKTPLTLWRTSAMLRPEATVRSLPT